MAHSNSTKPSLTKPPKATSVSPLEQSGSSKNDNSKFSPRSQRNLRIIQRLREIHELAKRKSTFGKTPLHYVCTATRCIDR